MKKKPIKVKEETLLGMAYPWLREIHISARQSPKELLDTYVHEVIHIVKPHMSEPNVRKLAEEISEVLWRVGYRLTGPLKRKRKRR